VVKINKKRNKHHNHHGVGQEDELIVNLVFTDVPESAAASQETYYRQLTELFGSVTSPKDRVCDVAMLVFDCSMASSLTYIKELESKLLTKETPRVFVGTKADTLLSPSSSNSSAAGSVSATGQSVVEDAQAHCQEEDLERQPLLVSSAQMNEQQRQEILQHLALCALNEAGVDRLKSRPYEEQERREAEKRRRMLWLGGIVSVGVVIAVGVSFLWGSSSSSSKKDATNSNGNLGWLRQLFGRHTDNKEVVCITELQSAPMTGTMS
jgi:hypothetical protein